MVLQNLVEVVVVVVVLEKRRRRWQALLPCY
jgi:hypothetical protein